MPVNDDSPGLNGCRENPELPPLRTTYRDHTKTMPTETSASTSCARVEICTPSTETAQTTIQKASVNQIQLMCTSCTVSSVRLRKPPNASPMASVSAIAPP